MELLYIGFTYWIKDDQQGVPGLAVDSLCDVWGRGWTTCLLCGATLLGLFLFNLRLVCKFDWVERIFIDVKPLFMFLYITQVLPSVFPSNVFYSETLLTKYCHIQ